MTSKPMFDDFTSAQLASMSPSGSTQSKVSPTSFTSSSTSSPAQFDRPPAEALENRMKYLLSLPVSTHAIDEDTLACHRTNRANNPCSNLGQNNRILSDGLVLGSTTEL